MKFQSIKYFIKSRQLTLFIYMLCAVIIGNIDNDIFEHTLNAQEDYVLREIDFKGNETFTTTQLMERIASRSHHGLSRLAFWKSKQYYSEHIVQRDVQRLISFYQSEGFLTPAISYELSVNHQARIVRVTFQIKENTSCTIDEVRYHFQLEKPDNEAELQDVLERLKSKLLSKPGERFRDQLIYTDKKLIIQTYSDKGYPFIDVKYKLELNQQNNTVTIHYDIVPEALCTFGGIDITGNLKTDSTIIKKHITFKKGEKFSYDAVQKTQREIYNLGLFQYVSVKVQMQERTNVLPIQITVKEASRWTTKVGTGYGKEDQFRTFIDTQYLGFLGGIRKLRFFAKHSGLEPYHFNIKLIQPMLFSKPMTLTLNPFLKQEKELGFTIDRVGTNISLHYYMTPKTNGYINYALEQDNLKITRSVREQGLNNSELNIYNKSSIILGLSDDSSSPAFVPNKGTRKSITFTYSGVGFRSDFHFWRGLIELRKYIQFVENYIIAFKIKAGGMEAIKQSKFTPIEERFYAGGSTSIRGWARSRLGPKTLDNRPIGGNSYLENSLELRYPLWKKLSGVYFIDFGNVWASSFTYHLNDLHYASGAGLRFTTPIGPIRFDVATPVFEGRQPWQFHISVGNSF